jgi:hypothetical protein
MFSTSSTALAIRGELSRRQRSAIEFAFSRILAGGGARATRAIGFGRFWKKDDNRGEWSSIIGIRFSFVLWF